jgi:hypothetical protein
MRATFALEWVLLVFANPHGDNVFGNVSRSIHLTKLWKLFAMSRKLLTLEFSYFNRVNFSRLATNAKTLKKFKKLLPLNLKADPIDP